jgi:hypothetical protein
MSEDRYVFSGVWIGVCIVLVAVHSVYHTTRGCFSVACNVALTDHPNKTID